MSDTPKRFDEWEQVDCHECTHYWDNSCDGVPKDSKKQCSSYVATRSIVLPERIKELEQDVHNLTISNTILGITLILSILCHIVGVF